MEKIASYAQLDDGEIWYDITGNSIHVLWYDYCMETGIQQYAYDKTYVKECQDADRIVLDFTGDFSLAEGVGTTDYYHSVGDDITKCLGADLRQEMLNADIMTINNEFVYSTRGQALAGKAYTFRGDPKTCQNLVLLGVDVAGLANNHVYDFGENAFLDTLDTLKAQNIPYIGAGRNLEEASEPIFFIANGKKIAIVAATQIERSTKYTKEATEDSPGVLKTLDSAKYVAQIAKAKQNADYVICYVHWGTEHTHQYGSDQVKLAKDFVAAGGGCHHRRSSALFAGGRRSWMVFRSFTVWEISIFRRKQKCRMIMKQYVVYTCNNYVLLHNHPAFLLPAKNRNFPDCKRPKHHP